MNMRRNLLLDAAKEGNLMKCNELLNDGCLIDVCDGGDRSALHWAAWNNQIDVVEMLLSRGADHDRRTYHGNTPLALACDHASASRIVKTLLDLGCDINNSDGDGDTPIHYASRRGNTEAVELLLSKGANRNDKNNSAETPLWLAVFSEHVAIVRILLDWGTDLYPCSRGISDELIGELFLYDVPVSPLWVATERGWRHIIHLLIMAGYNVWREKWVLRKEFPTEDHEIIALLQDFITNPLSLKSITRISIKRWWTTNGIIACDDTLPKTLVKYLSFVDAT